MYENSGFEKFIVEELILKKRDKLVGHSSKDVFNNSEENEVIDILEGNIQRTIVNGMPSITFSNRIHQILIQGMDNTVILKFLGRNIGFSVLQNKIYNMWRSSAPLHMMDIKNGYFLIKFENKLDCKKALSERPWTIFGQYLTVQPWTMAFDPTQAYPSVVMAWIRFLALPSSGIKENAGPKVGSSLVPNGANEKLQNSEELTTCSIAPGSCSRTLVAEEVPSNSIKGAILHVEGEPSAYRPPLTLKGYEKKEVVMEVDSLNSDKHLAVIFPGNKNANNINNALSINNSLVSVQEGFSTSGKRNKIRGKNTINKHNKILHGRNVRFKNSGSQHVSIKKSMEQLAKSISTFFKDNFDFGNSTINDEQQEGVNLL
ncbi:hypothetical protein Godav_002009 [Gossypium davidsonii]|uniref:DUF4283 domain-containing protein n=1 Tax=Gossypium davidsonii TaxID=34287 RepID=A0A7J8T4S4_GOSDV|nr:hypothetical protein [Gossypium davidsonii]